MLTQVRMLYVLTRRRGANEAHGHRANIVSKAQERALDPLLVPALLAPVTPSICWLRSAAARDTLAQHRCNSTALRATAGCSARASELSNFAPRLRPARRTVAR